MYIDYLCSHCCFLLDIVPNRQAVNDHGKKKCNDCGWTGEKAMHIRTDLDLEGKAWLQNDDRKMEQT